MDLVITIAHFFSKKLMGGMGEKFQKKTVKKIIQKQSEKYFIKFLTRPARKNLYF